MAFNSSNNTLNTMAALGMAALLGLTVACGGSEAPASGATTTAATPAATPEAAPNPDLITAADINMGAIDQGKVAKGKEIYELKCLACHSTGTNRVVGPGWKGIMEQRKPEWIMNMILHTDAMLETDAEAQALLEECLVRMPNQNLSKEEAFDVLEFMRTL